MKKLSQIIYDALFSMREAPPTELVDRLAAKLHRQGVYVASTNATPQNLAGNSLHYWYDTQIIMRRL